MSSTVITPGTEVLRSLRQVKAPDSQCQTTPSHFFKNGSNKNLPLSKRLGKNIEKSMLTDVHPQMLSFFHRGSLVVQLFQSSLPRTKLSDEEKRDTCTAGHNLRSKAKLCHPVLSMIENDGIKVHQTYVNIPQS